MSEPRGRVGARRRRFVLVAAVALVAVAALDRLYDAADAWPR